MFHQNCPGKAFVSRLILLHVQFNKRLVTMSIPSLSEEGSKRQRSRGRLQINAGRSEADLTNGVTSSTGGGHDRAGGEFTEEEMAIHRAHREACEVRWSTAKDLKSSGVQSDQRNHAGSITSRRPRMFFVLNVTTPVVEKVYRCFKVARPQYKNTPSTSLSFKVLLKYSVISKMYLSLKSTVSSK